MADRRRRRRRERAWPWTGCADAEAEHLFQRTYPSLHAHLKPWEERLRARHDQGRHWWELRRAPSATRTTAPAVVHADTAAEPLFALAPQGRRAGQRLRLVLRPIPTCWPWRTRRWPWTWLWRSAPARPRPRPAADPARGRGAPRAAPAPRARGGDRRRGGAAAGAEGRGAGGAGELLEWLAAEYGVGPADAELDAFAELNATAFVEEVRRHRPRQAEPLAPREVGMLRNAHAEVAPRLTAVQAKVGRAGAAPGAARGARLRPHRRRGGADVGHRAAAHAGRPLKPVGRVRGARAALFAGPAAGPATSGTASGSRATLYDGLVLTSSRHYFMAGNAAGAPRSAGSPLRPARRTHEGLDPPHPARARPGPEHAARRSHARRRRGSGPAGRAPRCAAGVLLWGALRDFMLWVETPAARARGALPAPARASCAGASWRPSRPSRSSGRRSSRWRRWPTPPSARTPARLVYAVRAIARWAERAGAPGHAPGASPGRRSGAPAGARRWRWRRAGWPRDLARHAQAESWFRAAPIKLARGRDWESYAWAFIGLGVLYIRAGNYPAARRVMRAARCGPRASAGSRPSAGLVAPLPVHPAAWTPGGWTKRTSTPEAALARLRRRAPAAPGAGARPGLLLAAEQGRFVRALPIFEASLPLLRRRSGQPAAGAREPRARGGRSGRPGAATRPRAAEALALPPPPAAGEVAAESLLVLAQGDAEAGRVGRARRRPRARRIEIAARRGEAAYPDVAPRRSWRRPRRRALLSGARACAETAEPRPGGRRAWPARCSRSSARRVAARRLQRRGRGRTRQPPPAHHPRLARRHPRLERGPLTGRTGDRVGGAGGGGEGERDERHELRSISASF